MRVSLYFKILKEKHTFLGGHLFFGLAFFSLSIALFHPRQSNHLEEMKHVSKDAHFSGTNLASVDTDEGGGTVESSKDGPDKKALQAAELDTAFGGPVGAKQRLDLLTKSKVGMPATQNALNANKAWPKGSPQYADFNPDFFDAPREFGSMQPLSAGPLLAGNNLPIQPYGDRSVSFRSRDDDLKASAQASADDTQDAVVKNRPYVRALLASASDAITEEDAGFHFDDSDQSQPASERSGQSPTTYSPSSLNGMPTRNPLIAMNDAAAASETSKLSSEVSTESQNKASDDENEPTHRCLQEDPSLFERGMTSPYAYEIIDVKFGKGLIEERATTGNIDQQLKRAPDIEAKEHDLNYFPDDLEAWQRKTLSLGAGGYIDIGIPNGVVCDQNGPELMVYLLGSSVPKRANILADLKGDGNYQLMGTLKMGGHPVFSIDLRDFDIEQAFGIRIQDLQRIDDDYETPFAGFTIDAIEVRNGFFT